MARNLQANIQIGATLTSGVASAFGGLKSKLDALKGSMKDLRQQSAMLSQMEKRQNALADLRAKLSAYEKAGKSTAKLRDRIVEQEAALAKLSGALRKAGVDTSNLTAAQARLQGQMQQVAASESRFRRLSENMAVLRTRAHAVGAAFGNVRSSLGSLMSTMAGAGLGLGAAGYAFKTQFIDRAAAFEKYRIQLQAFGDDAEKALKWSEQFAMKTPLDLDQVVGAFVRLRQQGLDPTDGTLQALTDAVFKTGGSIYDLEEIINQLGQAFRKEKLTAEDVKPLINRGIPVYEMLAKAMGKTTKEILAMQTEGKLGKEAIQGMLFEIGRWSQGTSEKMAGSWTGILGRMGDYWVKFTKETMESGPFKELKRQLEEFLAVLQKMDEDGTLKKWAEETGAAIVEFLRDLRTLAQELWSFTKATKDAVGGWKNFGIVIAGLALSPLILSVGQLTWAVGALAVQLGIVAGPSIIAGMTALTAGLKSMAIASWAAVGPWGLLAAGIIAAGAAIYTFRDEIMDLINSAINPLLAKLAELASWFGNTSVGRFFGLDTSNLDGTPQRPRESLPFVAPKPTSELKTDLLNSIKGQSMPSSGPKASVTNNMDISIDARGMDPQRMIQEIDKYRRTLPKTSLGDETGVLAPR
jgi:tape measure domain-containing protein